MDILGISAFYHDSAAYLVRDGEIVGSEDRQSHPSSMPCSRDCEVDDLRTV